MRLRFRYMYQQPTAEIVSPVETWKQGIPYLCVTRRLSGDSQAQGQGSFTVFLRRCAPLSRSVIFHEFLSPRYGKAREASMSALCRSALLACLTALLAVCAFASHVEA